MRKIAFTIILSLSLIKTVVGGTLEYVVKPGDSFYNIIKANNNKLTATYEEIIEINKKHDSNFNSAKLSIGQKIYLPVKGPIKKTVSKYYHPGDDFSDESQKNLLARVLVGETRGCNDKARKAVAATILFRIWSNQFGNDMHSVVLAPNQFEVFKPNNKAYPTVKNPERYAPDDWKDCLKIAEETLSGRLVSPIDQAFFFRSNKQLPAPYILVKEIPAKQGVTFYFYKLPENTVRKGIPIKIEGQYILKDRGAKTANYKVLRYTDHPSILIEWGFLSNNKEMQYFDKDQDNLVAKVGQAILRYVAKNNIKTVILDPGHGGKDSGAVNQELKLKEKDKTLKITFALGEYLRKNNVRAFYTRASDVFRTLDWRYKWSNSINKQMGPTIFISSHFNSAINKKAHGFEVFYYAGTRSKGQNSTDRIQKSKQLAEDVERYIR